MSSLRSLGLEQETSKGRSVYFSTPEHRELGLVEPGALQHGSRGRRKGELDLCELLLTLLLLPLRPPRCAPIRSCPAPELAHSKGSVSPVDASLSSRQNSHRDERERKEGEGGLELTESASWKSTNAIPSNSPLWLCTRRQAFKAPTVTTNRSWSEEQR